VYKEDLQVDRNKFDNSDYPEGSEFYHRQNKVIGKVKDKVAGAVKRIHRFTK